jgi:hypothetical protein
VSSGYWSRHVSAALVMKQYFLDGEIRDLRDELTMPVGEFGAVTAAALIMALGSIFVTSPSATERARTAFRHDIKSHAGSGTGTLGARASPHLTARFSTKIDI